MRSCVMKQLFKPLVLSVLLASATSGGRAADAIPYPNSGLYNPTTYSFTAANSGDFTAYIIGGISAGFENQLGLLVDGVSQGGYGLDNKSSAYGDAYDFGPVNAGQTLTFVLHNLSLNANAYSNPAMNVAYDDVGTTFHNHIYSTSFSGDSKVPSGVYVAFEDIPFPGADYNYNDESFVFSNTVATGAPEASTWAMMLLGFAGLGFVSYRASRKSSAGPALAV